MSAQKLRALLAGVYPILVDGAATRIEGPGYVGYRYKANAGDGSEVIRVDVTPADLKGPAIGGTHAPIIVGGTVDPFASIVKALRTVEKPDSPRRVDGAGWRTSRVDVPGIGTVLRVELRIGRRYADRFAG